jgi:16S rRNA processing protein RimM
VTSKDVEGHTAIGLIGRAVGLDGCCAVRPFGKTLGGLKPGFPVILLAENGKQVQSTLLTARRGSRGFRCTFEGCASREEAESVRGWLVLVEDRVLPPTSPNEYYHSDLRAMEVFSTDDGHIGKVTEVYNFPSVDAVEVERIGGSTVLVPFTAEIVTDVDPRAGRIRLDMAMLEELFE